MVEFKAFQQLITKQQSFNYTQEFGLLMQDVQGRSALPVEAFIHEEFWNLLENVIGRMWEPS